MSKRVNEYTSDMLWELTELQSVYNELILHLSLLYCEKSFEIVLSGI